MRIKQERKHTFNNPPVARFHYTILLRSVWTSVLMPKPLVFKYINHRFKFTPSSILTILIATTNYFSTIYLKYKNIELVLSLVANVKNQINMVKSSTIDRKYISYFVQTEVMSKNQDTTK